jgi:transposase
VLLPQIDADERVLIPLQNAGTTAVILPKANRKVQPDYDKELYKAQHLLENFFAQLKLFRAIATRYDKTARVLKTKYAREIDLLRTIYGECCAREVLFLPVR